MKTDLYTKTVLTVIAICLTINIVQQLNLIPSTQASVHENASANHRMVPLNADGSMDVNIVYINTSDVMGINIRKVDGSWLGFSGAIPVKIKQ